MSGTFALGGDGPDSMESTGKEPMCSNGASKRLASPFQKVAQMMSNAASSSVIQVPCSGCPGNALPRRTNRGRRTQTGQTGPNRLSTPSTSRKSTGPGGAPSGSGTGRGAGEPPDHDHAGQPSTANTSANARSPPSVVLPPPMGGQPRETPAARVAPPRPAQPRPPPPHTAD